MEAHALVARLVADVPFPFLCMLVSGGHNMLLVAHAVRDYTLMGSTLDDSVGEWAANVHTSPFMAPLFMTAKLKHAHCFVTISFLDLQRQAIHQFQHCIQHRSMQPFSMTRQNLAFAVLFYATLPSVSPVMWSGLSMSSSAVRFTTCWHLSHAIYALL